MAVSCFAYAPLLGNKARNPDAGVILPPLFEIKNPLEYINLLANFEVIDFQPLRDLTFFFDIFIFNHFGIVTFATTNVILWGFAGFFLFKIFLRFVAKDKELVSMAWTIAFMVYPLFTQAVPWGMARKHILAFLLILWATNNFLEWMENGKAFFKSYIAYVLAALSHPIFLLWPVWAVIHHAIIAPKQIAERKSFWIFFVTMLVLLFTNWAYYTIGNKKVAEVFGMAKPNLFDIPMMTFTFLFYFRQILYPYELTFQNYPSFANSWPGLILLGLIAILVFLQRKDRSTISWLLFLLLPFPIILTLPAVYDQYLLLPVVGVIILIIRKWDSQPRYVTGAVLGVSLVWGLMTFNEAGAWVNVRKIAERNFINSPSCKSASTLMMYDYAHGKKAPPDAVKSFTDAFCTSLHPDSPMKMRLGFVILESLMLYHEDKIFSHEFRVKRLKQLAEYNYFPDLIYASILSKEGKSEEIENISKRIMGKAGGMKLETGPVVDDVLRPYCVRENLKTCIILTEPNNENPPYL
jgi:hypothetical protein